MLSVGDPGDSERGNTLVLSLQHYIGEFADFCCLKAERYRLRSVPRSPRSTSEGFRDATYPGWML